MPTSSRVIENICHLPLTVVEARELYRRAVVLAQLIKGQATISSAGSFAKAELSRIALQDAVTKLSGDELSRISATAVASAVIDNTDKLCFLGHDLWELGFDFPGDPILDARDSYANWTQRIKAAHTPAIPKPSARDTTTLIPAEPVKPEGSGTGTGLILAGSAIGLFGLLLWANSRA